MRASDRAGPLRRFMLPIEMLRVQGFRQAQLKVPHRSTHARRHRHRRTDATTHRHTARQTHTHTHTHKHTHTHTPTHTQAHTDTHTPTHAHTHTRTRAHTHTTTGARWGCRLRQAAVEAFGGPDKRELCVLAGNAVPTEFALVIVRGLALCFPELFEATPRAWRRRSGRLGGL